MKLLLFQVVMFCILNIMLLTKYIHAHFNVFGASLVAGSDDVSPRVV